VTHGTGDKVPTRHAFLDVSDYARPFARWLVRKLLPTRVTPPQVTLAFTVAGLVAALLLALDRWPVVAAALILVKSGLDAADGALARVRQRPSRVGRFLDSLADFGVNLALYGALGFAGWRASGQAGYWLLAGLACVSAMLQVSLFNHYYIRYRAQTGGDVTSQVQEGTGPGFPWDNPRHVRVLLRLYQWVYGWQDSVIAAIDRWADPHPAPLRPGFMTATTVLGLGTQLLVLAVMAAVGQPVWALWVFVTLFNLYAIGLLLARATTADRRPRSDPQP
jgi:phosphatidylglycerophosphate synthase